MVSPPPSNVLTSNEETKGKVERIKTKIKHKLLVMTLSFNGCAPFVANKSTFLVPIVKCIYNKLLLVIFPFYLCLN